MKKINAVGAKQSKNFPEQKLTMGLDLGDQRAGIACWMKRGKCCWNKGSARLRKR